MSKTQEQVIRQFYKQFNAERVHILASLEGIDNSEEREHYASLLLYRLLFLYFLQHKGFLGDKKNFLSDQLAQRTDEANTFYRSFLLPLFYQLQNALTNRPLDSQAQQSLVASHRHPQERYHNKNQNKPTELALGHTFFAPHSIERKYPAIHLPDSSFARLFAFLDSYEWRLDTSSLSSPHVITPDILGHILEQYVNQQQMGAYYTHEDITSYIATYTLLPYLLESVIARSPDAFTPTSPHWQLLRAQPERYIHDAMRVSTSLPGETLQETAERLRRYHTLRQTLFEEHIHTIDDFITHNLDLYRFTLDLLETSFSETLLEVFFEELCQISVLDPTCGSGAFLFAALNVLVPLYEACLRRLPSLSRHLPDLIERDPTPQQQRCAILKTIMTRNLYGVDIMQEAIEICTLRFSLTLLAQAEHLDEIRPLPSLGRNLLVGNALVGYIQPHATQEEFPASLLDRALASDYGIPSLDNERFTQWHATHLPFHWWSAFPNIRQRGGFSVILGNPPYVEYDPRKFSYRLPRYETLPCANLYPCIIERSCQLLAPRGRQGMILPLAAFATRNMLPFLRGFKRWFPASWLSFYHFRPSMLFAGQKMASIPTAIYLACTTGPERRFSTHVRKWNTEQRPFLFPTLSYCQVTTASDPLNPHYYPKFGHACENTIMSKLLSQDTIEHYLASTSNQNSMHYRSAGGLYWKVFINFPWPYHTTSNKRCCFQERYDRDVFVALFNSSLFWWYYTVTFDTFNLKDYMLFGFRFTYPEDTQLVERLRLLCAELMHDYRQNALHRRRGQTGSYTVFARKSKHIIDAIDELLALHYGITASELAFIRNYDLKYRLGLGSDTST